MLSPVFGTRGSEVQILSPRPFNYFNINQLQAPLQRTRFARSPKKSPIRKGDPRISHLSQTRYIRFRPVMLPPNTEESCHGQPESISSIIHAEGVGDVYQPVTDGLPACR